MADFIQVAVDGVMALIQTYTPALLAAMATPRTPFTSIGRAYVAQLPNPPQCWVIPSRITFDDEGQGTRREACEVRVKLGISSASPEDLVRTALDYVRAIDGALSSARPADVGWEDSENFRAGTRLRPFVRGQRVFVFPGSASAG